MRPVAIDLFAGVGGMSLGLEQAGFDVACAVEYDPVHAACHLYNFPKCAMIVDTVAAVTGERIRSESGIGDRRVSLVVGGPPCQGFSILGKRILDDPRNALVKEFVRLVVELDADYFVFENVKGMVSGGHVEILRSVIGLFADNGYDVVPYRVLNARNFGVPQSRERLIVMGHKRGLRPAIYPVATHPSGRHVTCAEAFDGLPDVDVFDALMDGDAVAYDHPPATNDYASEMRIEKDAHWYAGERRVWDRFVLTSSARTAHEERSVLRFAAAPEGVREPVSRFFKLPRAGVSNTLRAGTDAKRGSFTSPRPIHYENPRCISVREMARLHGFPDWFRMHVTKWHGARQVGNAVPPPLARAVAREIMKASGASPMRSDVELALGDERLLSMNVTEACAFFGVGNLVGSRYRDARDAA